MFKSFLVIQIDYFRAICWELASPSCLNDELFWFWSVSMFSNIGQQKKLRHELLENTLVDAFLLDWNLEDNSLLNPLLPFWTGKFSRFKMWKIWRSAAWQERQSFGVGRSSMSATSRTLLTTIHMQNLDAAVVALKRQMLEPIQSTFD